MGLISTCKRKCQRSWQAGSSVERTLPTTPPAVIPRTMGVASGSMGAVPIDEATLDQRHVSRRLHWALQCKGV